MSYAGLNFDARAVVRAADDLTTQVRRIADALTAPADDGRRTVPLLTLATPCASCTHPYNWHKAGICQVANEANRCGCIAFAVEAPAADEDAVRAERLASLGVLFSRILNGLTLTTDEGKLLIEHVDAEIRESTTARAVAAGNKRHVQLIVPELEQAQAAIERVRAALAHPNHHNMILARTVHAALDGTEQSAEQQPTTCTATIPDSLNSPALHRCIGSAGHYDETDEPVHTGPDRSPGGWHTDGEGHVWSDRAASATPHREQPTTKES